MEKRIQCHYITDSNTFKLETAVAWINSLLNGKSPLDKLKKNGVEEIIIYGATELGKLLVEEAKIKGYKVLGITDKKVMGANYFYEDIPLLNRRQLEQYKEKCIVITSMTFWYDINEELSAKGYKNIVSLRELL